MSSPFTHNTLHIRTNWTMAELENYGFKPLIYLEFKTEKGRKFARFCGNKIASWFYERVERTSNWCMVYGDYRIICDEMDYVDVIYTKTPRNKPPIVLGSGRRDVTLGDMFDAIKEHRRGLNLNSLLVE